MSYRIRDQTGRQKKRGGGNLRPAVGPRTAQGREQHQTGPVLLDGAVDGGVHVLAGQRERGRDRAGREREMSGWVDGKDGPRGNQEQDGGTSGAIQRPVSSLQVRVI